MKAMKDLVKRFMEGETTLEEERRLYAYFSGDKVDEELQPYRDMFLGLASVDNIDKEEKASKSQAWVVVLRVVAAIAAVWVVGLFISLEREPENRSSILNPQLSYHNYSACTEGTPRDIYVCYMEQRKKRTNTYQQLRQLKKETYEKNW
ncbi:MAG: hypothetical protein J6Y04_09460 [Bacteroidaceae bacterium]|nr:hypothetical protein [Bacteroidaceae bacterium]